jgi:hypothetical protein
MARLSPLDDPVNAMHAWRRYWRLMRWMFAATTITVIFALTALYMEVGMVSVHLYIATALGISVAMLLMAGLMGLVFLSSGTGHDEAIVDTDGEDRQNDA